MKKQVVTTGNTTVIILATVKYFHQSLEIGVIDGVSVSTGVKMGVGEFGVGVTMLQVVDPDTLLVVPFKHTKHELPLVGLKYPI